MPVWWRGKSKWRRERMEAVESGGSDNNNGGSGMLDPIGGGVGAGFLSFESDGERKVVACHPLPRPTISPSGPPTPRYNTGASSVCSSGSEEEILAAPGGDRSSVAATVTPPRGRGMVSLSRRTRKQPSSSTSPIRDFFERKQNLPISPRMETQTHCRENIPNDTTISRHSPGSRSPGPRATEGYNLSNFVANPTARQDELSQSHLLPLPPAISAAPSSRSFQSKWKKGKPIGRGTFGQVYAGFNCESGEMCAIKEVEVIFDDESSRDCLKQLSQEINLLGQLSHPNIVQYCGCELIDNTLSVYLEYASGGSIRNLLREYGPFGEHVIRSYVAQIITGLAYLHGRNTIHRDIKGANILVDPNGVIKLADFGMARTMSSYTSVRSFRGSPYWMAPEVIKHSSDGYGLSVDIWSLGCTIIEMATTKPPWSQCTGVQAIFKIGSSEDIPEIPDHLSDEGKSFLKQCLQRDPSYRPTAAQLMDHPFVRGQAKTKFSHGNPSSSNVNFRPAINDRTSASPIQSSDRLMRRQTASPSDEVNPLRTTLSLAVSTYSSPLCRCSNLMHQSSPLRAVGPGAQRGNNSSNLLVHTEQYTEFPPKPSLPNSSTLAKNLPR